MKTSAVVGIVLAVWGLNSYAEPATQVMAGAEVGGGSVAMSGTRYGAVDMGVDLQAARWLSPTVAVGARVGFLTAVPLDSPQMDGKFISRQEPWIIEPEVLTRTPGVIVGPARIGWEAIGGLGATSVRIIELCNGTGDGGAWGNGCEIVKAKALAVEGTATAGAYLVLGYVVGFVGVRASLNSQSDRAAGVVANLGAAF